MSIVLLEHLLEEILENVRDTRQATKAKDYRLWQDIQPLVYYADSRARRLETLLKIESVSELKTVNIDKSVQVAHEPIRRLLDDLRRELNAWCDETGVKHWDAKLLEARHQEFESTGRDLMRRQYLDPRNTPMWWFWFALYVICGVPAIGGFILVGQMIREYGVCVLVTS